MRRCWSITAQPSASASSTSRAKPAGVRAESAGDDHGILSGHQHLRQLSHCRRIARGSRDFRKLRNTPVEICRHFALLQNSVGSQHHGHHRRGHRDLISAHGRFAEMSQRSGVVVPLGVIAHRGGHVLSGVQPLHAAATFGRIGNVAGHNEHRRLVAISVIDRHGGMLDAHRSVRAHQRRFAFNFGVAIGCRRRALFVRKGDELRIAGCRRD